MTILQCNKLKHSLVLIFIVKEKEKHKKCEHTYITISKEALFLIYVKIILYMYIYQYKHLNIHILLKIIQENKFIFIPEAYKNCKAKQWMVIYVIKAVKLKEPVKYRK